MENQTEEVVTDGNGEPVPQDNTSQAQGEPTQQAAPQVEEPPKWFRDYQAQQDERFQGMDRNLGQVRGLQGKFDQLIARLQQPSQNNNTPNDYAGYDPQELDKVKKLVKSIVQEGFGDKFASLDEVRTQAQYQQNSMAAQNHFIKLAGEQSKELEPIAAKIANSWGERALQGDQEAQQMVMMFTSSPIAAAKVLLAEARAEYSNSIKAQGDKATEALKASGQAAAPIPAKGKPQSNATWEAVNSMKDGPEKLAKMKELIDAAGGVGAWRGNG